MAAVMLDELSSREFGAAVKRNPLVILPVGAVEEHGSHLPLCTDSIQPEYIAKRVAARLGGTVMIAPPLRYGCCSTTRNFPGTLSLSFESLRGVVSDILSELCRHGVRRVVVLSGHAGGSHMASLRLAGEGAVQRCPDLKLMILSDYDIAYELRGREFDDRDGHAGAIETSRVMAISPRLVRGRGSGSYERPPRFMILSRPESCFPSGVVGDPTLASASKGRRINEHIIKGLVGLIKKHL
ncbi:MAG: creatininase family protein [Thermoplasmatota archaeon]